MLGDGAPAPGRDAVTDPLRRLIGALALLEERSGARLVVIGGVARGAWATPRATADVDVLVDRDDATELVPFAAAGGLVAVAEEVERLRASGMTRLRLPDQLQGDVRLDVIAADHPYYRRVIARSRRVPVFGHDVRVAAPEDVLLLKLLADRAQDRADVDAIVAAQGAALDLDLIAREAAELEVALPAALRPRV